MARASRQAFVATQQLKTLLDRTARTLSEYLKTAGQSRSGEVALKTARARSRRAYATPQVSGSEKPTARRARYTLASFAVSLNRRIPDGDYLESGAPCTPTARERNADREICSPVGILDYFVLRGGPRATRRP